MSTQFWKCFSLQPKLTVYVIITFYAKDGCYTEAYFLIVVP